MARSKYSTRFGGKPTRRVVRREYKGSGGRARIEHLERHRTARRTARRSRWW